MTLAAVLLIAGLQGDVVRRAEGQEIQYEIRQGDCRIGWTLYLGDLNRGVIRHRADCGLNLADQAPLVGRLLSSVLRHHPDIEFRSLSWGRIYPDGATDATLAARLALAAHRSKEWNGHAGRPARGDANGFVRDLSNRAGIYRELSPVFAGHGLKFRISSAEKVLVLPAERLPFYDRLRSAGVRPGEKLPFDCQAWFTLRE